MDIEATKIDLVKRILDETNEVVLQKVSHLLHKEAKVVAYSTAGEPLTKESYNAMLQEGEADIESGKTVDKEELKKRVRTWENPSA